MCLWSAVPPEVINLLFFRSVAVRGGDVLALPCVPSLPGKLVFE